MENKLTAAILCTYHGAKVRPNTGKESSVLAVDIANGYVVTERKKICNTFDIHNCQLILTPISLISDEDIDGAYEVAGIAPWIDDFSKEKFINIFSPTECAKDEERYGQRCYYIIIDYLRSKGYDCGYGEHPSLIEAGIAISSADVK